MPVLNPQASVADDFGTTEPPPKVQFLQWLVDPNTYVSTGERIAELLTPGIVYHVSSPAEGRLEILPRRTGSEVFAGDLLGSVYSAERFEFQDS